MNEYMWIPVEDGTEMRCDCGLCDRGIYADDDRIVIYDDVDNEELSAHLPDDYALCRRVPAPVVPVDALKRITAWVIAYGGRSAIGAALGLAATVITLIIWLV